MNNSLERLQLGSSDGSLPTETAIKEEMLAVWDAYSPLSLSALHSAFNNGQTLDRVGIDVEEARACVNKYNSIIFRRPGQGPMVAPSEAAGWVSMKMSFIVSELAKRSA